MLCCCCCRVLLACPPGDIGFGVAVVVAIGVVSLSTRCVFICIVIDCGTAAPHAEQTASGATSTSQRFPATDIIHQPAVSALPRRRWIVDDCRACTCVLCAVGVMLIVALLHVPCLFWPYSPDTIFLFCCCCWVHQFSLLYCIFIGCSSGAAAMLDREHDCQLAFGVSFSVLLALLWRWL